MQAYTGSRATATPGLQERDARNNAARTRLGRHHQVTPRLTRSATRPIYITTQPYDRTAPPPGTQQQTLTQEETVFWP